MINGTVELEWGDGDQVFNIAKIKECLELEEKCGDCGIFEIFNRITEGKARLNDIRETIRLGLIGGGKTPVQALVLVKRYVDDRPLIESLPVARTILMAALVGVPGDEVGKKQEAERTETEATHALSDPPSTESEPQSGSPPDRSMKSPSGNSVRASMAGARSMARSQRPNL